MGTRHLYWILTGPSFAVRRSSDSSASACCTAGLSTNPGSAPQGGPLLSEEQWGNKSGPSANGCMMYCTKKFSTFCTNANFWLPFCEKSNRKLLLASINHFLQEACSGCRIAACNFISCSESRLWSRKLFRKPGICTLEKMKQWERRKAGTEIWMWLEFRDNLWK